MSHLLGIDLGSSSVKVSLVDAESGSCVASASAPSTEAPIKALQPGWAEQSPDDWWQYLKDALAKLKASGGQLSSVKAIGISYQMHGLVCLDKDLRPLRDAIIWCDSRGVPYGERAYNELGEAMCLGHLHNSPGNFTATKLAWVKENEPELFARIKYIMLPGDWLALRLSGVPATTASGLSEMMLWDYGSGQLPVAGSQLAAAHCSPTTGHRPLTTDHRQPTTGQPAYFLMDYFGFPHDILPPLVPTFGEQGRVGAAAAAELGLPEGALIAYRAGDQPNNALSLAVLEAGQVASTAGTSGVVYGVNEEAGGMGSEKNVSAFRSQTSALRINTFLHVNHKLGLMHCVNGCGILNAWMRRMVAPGMSYDEINRVAASVPVGSEGVSIVPFGNGAERVLENRNICASVHGVDFNRHGQAHLLRAAQEGVAFALVYGMELMGGIETIHAGRANMFLSPLFRQALAGASGATIELYDTDGSVGAARGAGLGAGIYASPAEAFASLECLQVNQPTCREAYSEAYARWKSILEATINNTTI